MKGKKLSKSFSSMSGPKTLKFMKKIGNRSIGYLVLIEKFPIA
jgi:hypothetical protein